MFDTDSGTHIRNRIAQANTFEDIMALVIEATSRRHGNAAARLLETPTDRNTRFEALRRLSEPDAKIAECAATRLRQLFGAPRKRPAHHASHTDADAGGSCAQRPAKTDAPLRRKILVADDTATTVTIAACALQNAGYKVVTAQSGSQAVEAAVTHGVDLALLDYRMPGMDGLQTGKAIHELTGARFVMMSAYSDNDVIHQAAVEGALGFIVKPLDVKELAAQIGVALTRADEIRQLKDTLQDCKENYNAAIAKAVRSARSVNTAIGILMERWQRPREQVCQSLTSDARNQRRRLVALSEELISASEGDYAKRIESISTPAN